MSGMPHMIHTCRISRRED